MASVPLKALAVPPRLQALHLFQELLDSELSWGPDVAYTMLKASLDLQVGEGGAVPGGPQHVHQEQGLCACVCVCACVCETGWYGAWGCAGVRCAGGPAGAVHALRLAAAPRRGTLTLVCCHLLSLPVLQAAGVEHSMEVAHTVLDAFDQQGGPAVDGAGAGGSEQGCRGRSSVPCLRASSPAVVRHGGEVLMPLPVGS